MGTHNVSKTHMRVRKYIKKIQSLDSGRVLITLIGRSGNQSLMKINKEGKEWVLTTCLKYT
jgi:hypothetical protein